MFGWIVKQGFAGSVGRGIGHASAVKAEDSIVACGTGRAVATSNLRFNNIGTR
jgi:hypothetical protein